MAKRKRSTRSPSRSPRRSSSRTSSNSSLVLLAVVVGVGALGVWAATQHKSELMGLARLFERSTTHASRPAAVKPEVEVKQSARPEPRQDSSRSATSDTPVPRPSIAVGAPQNTVATPAPRVALQSSPAVQRPQASIVSAEKAGIHVPRGINMPNMSPSVVYAREKLTLRRNAWDKSDPVGTVEKGREMRSYSKTGKWHRIVVPATDMIGWVHEDMLIVGKPHFGVSSMATGAISGASKTAQVPAIYPPKPVGAR